MPSTGTHGPHRCNLILISKLDVTSSLFWNEDILIIFSGSIYLTMAIAMERYTTVCHPFFKVKSRFDVKFIKKLIPKTLASYAKKFNIYSALKQTADAELLCSEASILNRTYPAVSCTNSCVKNYKLFFVTTQFSCSNSCVVKYRLTFFCHNSIFVQPLLCRKLQTDFFCHNSILVQPLLCRKLQT